MALAVILIATSMQVAAQTETSVYERLGGVFAISAVVDHFGDSLRRSNTICQYHLANAQDGAERR